MNKKERKLACATALQSAASDMLVVESFEGLTGVSTKGLVASLAAMGIEEVRRRPLAPLSCPPLPAIGRTGSVSRLARGGRKPHLTTSSSIAVLLLHQTTWPRLPSPPPAPRPLYPRAGREGAADCERGQRDGVPVGPQRAHPGHQHRQRSAGAPSPPPLAACCVRTTGSRRALPTRSGVLHRRGGWAPERAARWSPSASCPRTAVPQVYDVLNADRIVVEQSALAYLNEWFGGEQ
jgi:hypothetical protein